VKINPINRINIEISTLANKDKPYLSYQMFNLAKEHQFGGQFGRDYITLQGMPETLLKLLNDWKIKFRWY
jgi:hypothetical protein